MCDFRNAHKVENVKEFKPTDLIKLSFDEDEVERPKPSMKKAKELLGSSFKINAN